MKRDMLLLRALPPAWPSQEPRRAPPPTFAATPLRHHHARRVTDRSQPRHEPDGPSPFPTSACRAHARRLCARGPALRGLRSPGSALADVLAQYALAHTTRLALGWPVNGQVPGSPGASGMHRTVTPSSSLILASSLGSPLKCVIAKPPWIGVGSLGFLDAGAGKQAWNSAFESMLRVCSLRNAMARW